MTKHHFDVASFRLQIAPEYKSFIQYKLCNKLYYKIISCRILLIPNLEAETPEAETTIFPIYDRVGVESYQHPSWRHLSTL